VVDKGIKKAIVKMDNLPPVDKDNSFSIRYRIVSDDKNRVSSWSPTFNVANLPAILVPGAVNIANNVVTVVWTDNNLQPDREGYDIFVKWDDGAYFHHGTSYMHNFSFLNQATSSVSVLIQLEGFEKTVNPLLKIFEETKSVI
jgi:hypothetical protein